MSLTALRIKVPLKIYDKRCHGISVLGNVHGIEPLRKQFQIKINNNYHYNNPTAKTVFRGDIFLGRNSLLTVMILLSFTPKQDFNKSSPSFQEQ